MKNARYLAICCLIIFGCSNSKSNKTVYIEIAPSKLTVNKEIVGIQDLERRLRGIIDEKKKAGIRSDELTVDVTVDPRTKRGTIADFEMILRKVNLRKLTFREPDLR